MSGMVAATFVKGNEAVFHFLGPDKSQNVPPYVIFHDTTLKAMAAAKPQSIDELAALPGVGSAKLQRYGEAFLQALVG